MPWYIFYFNLENIYAHSQIKYLLPKNVTPDSQPVDNLSPNLSLTRKINLVN